MIIDLVFAVMMLMAVSKGIRRGLVVALFSLLALVIGLAAALKLSVITAHYLEGNVDIPSKWLPLVSFLLVFLVVLVLVQWLAKMLEAALEFAFLGWLNKAGGILFYVLLYGIIFSIFLFYAEELKLVNEKTLERSITYAALRPWGPAAIDMIGRAIPVFKDMFSELKEFFGNMAQNAR